MNNEEKYINKPDYANKNNNCSIIYFLDIITYGFEDISNEYKLINKYSG